MDFGSSTLASGRVCLELVTQYFLLAVEATHVINTAQKEWSWIHHADTLSETKKPHSEYVEERAGTSSDQKFKCIYQIPLVT